MNHKTLFKASVMFACTILFVGCSQEPAPQEDVPLVMVAQPQASALQVQSYAGEVIAREQSNLSFRVAGQVLQRFVDVGDHVKAGQVLAKLDVKDAQLQKNAAQAELDSAQANLNIASTEFKRYQQLLPSHAVSRSQYDAVQNQYTAAQARLKQAQSNFYTANNQTAYNQLRATQSGVITQRMIETGQVVAAGQTAYQIAVDGERDILIGLPEQQISQIKVGQTARIVPWSKPDMQISGSVREVSPAANATRTFPVKVAAQQSNLLQIGQSARVFFSSQQSAQLYVPLSSVSAENNQSYVWVVKPDHTLSKVSVKVGTYGRDNVAVLSGLKAEDYVVIAGVHLLRAQQKIQPIDRNNRPVRIVAGA